MSTHFHNRPRGSTFILMAIITVVLTAAIASFLAFVMDEVTINKKSVNGVKALYLADAGINRATYLISRNNLGSIPAAESYQLGGASALAANPVSITISARTGGKFFDVTSTATVSGQKKTIEAVIAKNPPSKVFDYVYFLNNWGYAWGSGITLNGDIRSNGHYGVKWNPTLNGNLYAAGNIHYGDNYSQALNPSDVNGYASNPNFWHPQSERVTMPNLYQLQYYRDLAGTKGGKVWIAPAGITANAGNTVVTGVYGNQQGQQKNVVLAATGSDIIHVDGPVVVEGDVIIRGKITGRGCIYSGKNIYLAGDITYNDGPSFSTRPADPTSATYEQDLSAWVQANANKDIVGFAAQENIIAGNWTQGSWYPNQYINMWQAWGNEDVGMDGIPYTNDTGEGDGQWTLSYEDVDGDGAQDDNYRKNIDVDPYNEATQSPKQYADFDNRPAWAADFNQVYEKTNVSRLDGIYYTNHLFAAGASNVVFNGSVISKDEAIVYASSLVQNYDDRIHSKFYNPNNPVIDIDIPKDLTAKVFFWKEKGN